MGFRYLEFDNIPTEINTHDSNTIWVREYNSIMGSWEVYCAFCGVGSGCSIEVALRTKTPAGNTDGVARDGEDVAAPAGSNGLKGQDNTDGVGDGEEEEDEDEDEDDYYGYDPGVISEEELEWV